MKSLEKRKAQRKYFAEVNAGKVDDPVVTHGTDASGRVIGDEGKPVNGTEPGGDNANSNGEGNSGGEPVDYTKLTTHDALDKALEGRTKPEGWDDRETFKVADKQKWLAEHPANANETGAGGNTSGGW